MNICSFCGASSSIRVGRLRLCDGCRAQLDALRPNDPRYMWYAAAVRRALFASSPTQPRPASEEPPAERFFSLRIVR